MWCHDIAAPAVRRAPGEAARSSDVDADAFDVGPETVVLGIETSCDETAAALVMGGSDVCRA